MNKTHRSIWNALTQTYVAVAETVNSRGKPCSSAKALATAMGLAASLGTPGSLAQTPPPANALPTGGQVSAGQAAISQNGTHMLVQQDSARAAINWQSFNVGQDAHVQF